MLGLKVGNDLNIFCNRFKPSLPLRQDTDVHSSALLFFSEQVIWPSISTDLLALHIEIQLLVFDADEANGQTAQYVENHWH